MLSWAFYQELGYSIWFLPPKTLPKIVIIMDNGQMTSYANIITIDYQLATRSDLHIASTPNQFQWMFLFRIEKSSNEWIRTSHQHITPIIKPSNLLRFNNSQALLKYPPRPPLLNFRWSLSIATWLHDSRLYG